MYHLIFDTNVFIGYIHKKDRLNPKCEELINLSKKHHIVFFQRLHTDDFNSAIKNRVIENMKKIKELGIWDYDKNGELKIKSIDDFRKNLENKKLTVSEKGWIDTILSNIDSIDDLRNYTTKAMLIIPNFRRDFDSFIAHLNGKNRIQGFWSDRSRNTDEKNEILDLFDNETSMKERFFSKIDAVYNRKGRMGLIDKKLLVMSYWCAIEFYDKKYRFITDDSDMKPKTNEIERIFCGFKIKTIDDCNKMLQ